MRQIRAVLIGFCLGILAFPSLLAQTYQPSAAARHWADSLLQAMTLEQKIGQVFMADVYARNTQSNRATIARYLQSYHLGGLIFMQGDPQTQVQLVNEFQQSADIPLMIGQDAEWGLSMRLNNTLQFPKNMTLGAIRNDSLIYDMGVELGYQLRKVGVHVNFAPVIDINNNPQNPVINHRSYGENKFWVARKGLAFSKGMMEMGIFPCMKHFPGHGDTDTDSHLDLPVMHQSRSRLDTLELYPFANLIRSGVPTLMSAHLQVPKLDPTPQQPASLSPYILQDLLRDSMGFKGLIFSDALNMKGVTRFYNPGEVALKALQAGNDVLLFSENIPQAFNRIKTAILQGEYPESSLDEHVRRILSAKYSLGLYMRPQTSRQDLISNLNSHEAQLLNKQLYEAALTLAQNKRDLLPLNNLDQRKIAYIQVGGRQNSLFERTLKKYTGIDSYYLPRHFSAAQRLDLLKKLKGYNTTIMGVFSMNTSAHSAYGISIETRMLSQVLAQRNAASILTLFGNPYSLQYFGEEDAILVAYEDVPDAERAAAAAIFGGIPVTGRLPVSASPQFPSGTGVEIRYPIRFGFAFPEEVGMDGNTLGKIDSIANFYIGQKAMPGCAVLAMRGNQVVYERGFGKIYNHGTPVDPYQHTYDIASVSKVAVTTLAVMRLVDENRLNLDRSISTYLPELRRTDLAILTPRALLQHTGGLPGWIPFFRDTYADQRMTRLDPFYYSVRPSRTHTVRLAPRLYANPVAEDSIWQRILNLDVRRTTRYRYSDVGFIILGKVIEAVTRQPLEDYLSHNFYRPLGMSQSLFNPALQGKDSFCPPTERDQHWRFSTIQGYTHDPTAALMGGVAGHAGLFSNVYDLGKLMLMLKDQGRYGGRVYLKASTIAEFTRRQTLRSRRGLGFDKPQVMRGGTHPTSRNSSTLTFGHTGFTGTAVWTDPQHDLVYIFLSNRTYPSSNNRKLIHEHVRTKIMDVLYESIDNYGRYNLAP